MSTAHADYDAARREAGEMADRLRLDVAIRKLREYGRTVYRVRLACRSDSDYALAEIVRPDDPPWR